MTSFLLIISFLLHLVLFIIIYYLYQHIQTLKIEQTNEINELLNKFLHEIKAENETLQRSQQHFQNRNQWNESDKEKAAVINENNHDLNRTNHTKDEKEASIDPNPTFGANTPIPNKSDKIETSMHSQVYYLYENNHSIEEIAKKLNCSTTEVQLLIKFNET